MTSLRTALLSMAAAVIGAVSAAPALAASHKEAPMLETSGCEMQAGEKKLAGAARTSFLKKCKSDASGGGGAHAGCARSAAERKLAGAAKTSHIKKCEAEAASASAQARS